VLRSRSNSMNYISYYPSKSVRAACIVFIGPLESNQSIGI
jgi:hypothetical protein